MAGYYAEKVAVITGAGSGIGQALAVELARRGATLAISDQDTDALGHTKNLCHRHGAQVRADTVDVTDRHAMQDYTSDVWDDVGRIHLVFAVAGTIHAGSLLTSDLADMQHVINVNLWGVIHTVKGFLPHVLTSGGGHVVNISSGFGLIAAPYYSAYNASKFAVRGFSESLRQEMVLDGHPVSVTCVYPGGVRTNIMNRGRYADGEDAAKIQSTFDRYARTQPEQAAATILHGVRRRRAQVLVGKDAHLVEVAVRVLGSGYQRLVPWIGQRLRSRDTTS